LVCGVEQVEDLVFQEVGIGVAGEAFDELA